MMKSKKWDRVYVGLLLACFGEVIGFVLVYFIYRMRYEHISSWEYFWNHIFLGLPDTQSAVLTLSMVFNAFIFFLLLNNGHQKAAKAIIGFGLLMAPYVVYLKFWA